VNGSVVIGHGISSPRAIMNMILLSKEIHEAKLTRKIKRAMNKYIQSK
jgi:glycerol-3-phosphate acyltransferase PlsX